MNSDIKKKFAELQSKIQDCINWANNSVNEATAENKQMAEDFRTTFKHIINPAFAESNIEPINELTASVDKFIADNKIQIKNYGGRRRKSASSSHHHRRRRSSKSRATKRKPKRSQRRGSRRAY